MWKEGHRRSPRISALGTFSFRAQQPGLMNGVDPISLNAQNGRFSTLVMEGNSGSGQGPASRTRGRKKRKLRPVGEVASSSASKQGGETHGHENHQTNNGQESGRSCTTKIPEKRVLELILDILQRRDTHEIFAEPVDPNEVEDYYSIIGEPMDFGTMRAKLHEGMYRTLEEFEHDVFLITKNAMHFNSSTTIYFRQARAINELAQKVFQSLKADPKQFELEFVDARQRSGRRFPVTDSVNGLPSKMVAKDGNSKCVKNNASSKTFQNSFGGSSNLLNEKPGFPKVATCVDARDHEILPGNGYGQRSKEDHRHAYKPRTSFLSENELVYSTIYHNNAGPLELVTQKDISYSESLMLFVKDLGPTVQMIAKYRLMKWFPDAFCFQTTTSPRELLAANPLTSPIKQMDTGYADKKINMCNVKNIDNFCSATEEATKVDRRIENTVVRDVFANDEMESFRVFAANNIHQSSSHEMLLGLGDSQVFGESSESTSEHRKPNFWEQGLKNSDDPSSSYPLQDMYISCSETNIPKPKSFLLYSRGDDQSVAVRSPSYGVRCSSEAHQFSQLNQTLLPTSQFIFDLPFLKNRLDQMNYTANEKGLHQHSIAEKGCYFEITRCEYDNPLSTGNHQAGLSSCYGADILQRPLFDNGLNRQPDLALEH